MWLGEWWALFSRMKALAKWIAMNLDSTGWTAKFWMNFKFRRLSQNSHLIHLWIAFIKISAIQPTIPQLCHNWNYFFGLIQIQSTTIFKGSQNPASKKNYVGIINLMEKLDQLINFVMVKATVPCLVWPKYILCYYIYFSSDTGNDAFEFLLPIWYAIVLSKRMLITCTKERIMENNASSRNFFVAHFL